jgi:hypothetical protein
VTSLGIVGRERAESTNACGAPSSAVKHEVHQPLQAFSARISWKDIRSLAEYPFTSRIV